MCAGICCCRTTVGCCAALCTSSKLFCRAGIRCMTDRLCQGHMRSSECSKRCCDVQEWHNRVHLFEGDAHQQIQTYTEAVKTVDPNQAVGKPHTMWCAFAHFYERHGDIENARVVFDKATQVRPPCCFRLHVHCKLALAWGCQLLCKPNESHERFVHMAPSCSLETTPPRGGGLVQG